MEDNRLKAKLEAMKDVAFSISRHAPFSGRDLSAPLIEALIAYGIDAPERLLFMDDVELKRIPGVGAKRRKEVESYRQRFLSGQGDSEAR